MPDYYSLSEAQAALANPALPPNELAAVAAAQPGLWAQVAQHPSAYAALLDWMSPWADAEVSAAIASRRAQMAQALASNQLRQAIGKLTLVVTLAIVTMQLVTPTVIELGLIALVPSLRDRMHVTAGTIDTASVTEALKPWLGWIMIAAAASGACLYFILRGRRLVSTDISTTVPVGNRWATLGKIVVLFFSVQMFLTLAMDLITRTGYDPSRVQAQGIDPLLGSAAGIAYVTLVGPALEEIMFRGAILRHLAPYGVNFAIVTQAMLFGLYHLNLYQGFFAFVIGLLLGYVAINFSLKWSILLHIANNSLVLLPTTDGAQTAMQVVFGLCAIGAVVIAILDRQRGRPLISAGSSPITHVFRTGWSHPAFIAVTAVLFVICTLMMILM